MFFSEMKYSCLSYQDLMTRLPLSSFCLESCSLNYPLSTFWKIRPPNTCHRNNHLLLISNSPFTFGAGPESPSRRIHHSFNGFGVAATNSAHGSLLSLAAWPQLLVETPRLLLFGKTYCTNQLMQKRQAPIRCCFPQNFPFAVWTY